MFVLKSGLFRREVAAGSVVIKPIDGSSFTPWVNDGALESGRVNSGCALEEVPNYIDMVSSTWSTWTR